MLNKNINDKCIFFKLNELVHTDIKKTILKKKQNILILYCLFIRDLIKF